MGRKRVLILILPLFAVAALSLFFYKVSVESRKFSMQVDHAIDVMNALRGTRSYMEEADSAKDQFLKTGNEEYRAEYDAALNLMWRNFNYAGLLIVDPLQQNRINSLRRVINSIINESKKEIAQSLVSIDSNNQLMKIFHAQIIQILEIQTTELKQRNMAEQASFRRIDQMSTSGIFLLLLFCSMTSFLIYQLMRHIDDLEKAHREEKERRDKIQGLLRILDESPDFIGTSDFEGNLKYHNVAAKKMLGLPLDSNMEGLKIADMHPAWAAKFVLEKGIPEVLAHGSWQAETALLHRLGHEFPVSQVLFMVKDEQGKPAYLATIMRDISALKRIQNDLLDAMKVKSEFTSMVSHELRTPLTVIKESVAIVYDETAGPVNPDQKDFLETAKRNVDRLGRLINDVLDYQKLESHHMEMRMVQQSINDVIQEVRNSFEIVLAKRSISLEMRLQTDLPNINFDKDKIIQVLVNLVNNAVKFTDRGSIILTSQMIDGKAIKVSVKDSGIGIMKEDLDKLFKSFSQISTGTGRQTGGTGLGLALCKKIIEHHHGTVGVDSVYGQGSTFYFILPIEEKGMD